MIAQLDKVSAMFTARYHATGIPRFLEWWTGELAPLIPPRIKRLFAVPHEQLLICADAHSIYLWQASDEGRRLLDTLEHDSDPDQTRARIVASLDEFKEGTPAAIYCIPADSILKKTIRMPAAAEANLRQAVAFEIDRQTPFSAQEVYFDLQIVDREPPFLNVDLILAQRTQVDAYLEQMQGMGLRLQGVDVNTSSDAAKKPEPMQINLLPREQRVTKANKRVRLNWMLAGVAILLLVVVMAESLYLRAQTIEQLQQQRDAVRSEALQVSKLRQSLDESLAAANFLANKRANTPLTLEVLAGVTSRLPEDTWVQRFQINEKESQHELQLQGLSDGAQKLVESLNDAEALSATFFKGAISTDQRLNKERFTSASTIDPKATFVLAEADSSEPGIELNEPTDSEEYLQETPEDDLQETDPPGTAIDVEEPVASQTTSPEASTEQQELE